MNNTIETLLDYKGPHTYTIAPTATVSEAVVEMNKHNLGSLGVTEGYRLVGMFTARDLMRKVIPELLDPRTTCVRDVMHTNCPHLTRNMPVEKAMEVFAEHHFRHLPVIENHRLVGIISIGDLARWCTMANRASAESFNSFLHIG